MANYAGIYKVQLSNTAVTGAITLCQINAAATASVELIRAYVTFNSTTSTAIEVGLKRVTTAGTATAFTALVHNPLFAAFSGTCSVNSTAEGTAGDLIHREFVNYLNGFLWLPVPEERIILAPSGRIALYLPTAPGASVNITAGMVFATLG